MVEQANQSILPLKLTDIVVRKRGTIILNGLSLRVESGETTVLMGPNGSGKTTLLRLINGLERPRSGSIAWVLGDDEARHHQAFVFQSPILLRRTVLENIAYPLALRGHSKKESLKAAEIWAEKSGLQKHSHKDAHFLSGGERQKLAIARALIVHPQVLLLDEPTTNLDGQSTREIEALLLSATEAGATLIMATHDLGQAKRLAQHVAFLHKGSVLEHAPASQFFANSQSAQAQAYIRGDIVE